MVKFLGECAKCGMDEREVREFRRKMAKFISPLIWTQELPKKQNSPCLFRILGPMVKFLGDCAKCGIEGEVSEFLKKRVKLIRLK